MLKPVYALVGPDLFLQLESLGELLRQAPRDAQRINVDGESAELGDVLDELRSFAMFSSAKVLVVRNADPFITKYRESLEGYITRPAPDSTLVLRVDSLPSNQRIHKAIAALGGIVSCAPPKDLPRWILERAQRAHGLKMDSAAARMMEELVGADLARIDSELARLALQCEGNVSAAAIAASVSFQREQEMWNMTDEVAAGNTCAALRRWQHLVQSDTSAEYRAITWLTIWLEKTRGALAMRRSGMNEADIVRALKIWPAEKARPLLRTAAALGEAKVARLINLLTELDHRSKSGLGEMASNVERFLLAVGGMR